MRTRKDGLIELFAQLRVLGHN
ncbi:hypothetical protein CY0110_18067 [Crocosphaera chwakensis CCY0110]|uniref:Uncharacterized protein n=1 Tax=Crocosphaera chwakensis CCY0110 TaxID=391612 RepID=A3IIU5_9CHRO|nr:hypothetical protein CY0110_18067 [Crocosphaera chwakensis CCY0110]